MSKELEALERIINYWVIFDEEKDDCKQIKDILPKSSKIVETALEGLANIITLCKEFGIDFINYGQIVRRLRIELNNAKKYYYNDYSIVIKFAKENGKKLKALEIIKEYVNVEEDENGLYWLNVIGCSSIGIPKEKYDLLKEVLNNESC